MKIKQKQTKIGTKMVFSYKKAKNKVRKRRGLSPVSTLGLTLAFNNRNIGKKVILSLICSVMIGLILVSSSMIFSTYEQTFYNFMKQDENSIVLLETFEQNLKEEDIIETIKVKYGKKAYKLYTNNTGHALLNDYIGGYSPVKKWEELPEQYYYIPGMYYVIFIDNPSDLGIKMLKGVAPRGANEIAISKTLFYYYLDVGEFQDNNGNIIKFEKEKDLIGKLIEGFNIIITGVFEDNNPYYEGNAMEGSIDINSNILQYAIIRPEIFAENIKYLYSYPYHVYSAVTQNLSATETYEYSGYIPTNEFTKSFFYKEEEFKAPLNRGEVILDKNTAENLKREGKEAHVGDKITLFLVDTKWDLATKTEHVDKLFDTKEMTIVGISDRSYGGYIISNADFLDFNSKAPRRPSELLVNSQGLKKSFLREMRQKYSMLIFMNNFDSAFTYNNEYIDIFNQYVAAPLLCVALLILCILLCVISSDTIRRKSQDILTLKALGIDNAGVTKIFGLSIVILLAIQLIFGVVIGLWILDGVNYLFAVEICRYANLSLKTFWIGWANVLLTICAILTIVAITLWYSIQRLSGKNLRKMFQRQRK